MKDEIFKHWQDKKFSFNAQVASVFDDMIFRSVPFYSYSNELICTFLSKILPKNSQVSDLGCSLASFLLALYKIRPDLKLLGIDSSKDMIKQAKNKIKAHGAKISINLGDIIDFDFKGNDAIVLNYTLQFIKPQKREKFLQQIRDNLNPNGILILSEKLDCKENFGEILTEIYEDYKETMGYTRLEIAKKKEALADVLIPFSEQENINLCKNAGFDNIFCLFRWANFATFVAY